MQKITDLIGNTPMVKIQNLFHNENLEVFAKLEGNNPGGSVKDRAAYNMIKQAIQRGELSPSDHLVEATSGNTGIALAMIAGIYKIPITLIMPESATQERIDTMKAFGAEVFLTPAEKTIEYSRLYAEELVSKKGYKLLNQFANDDNWKMHYATTGPEIWRDSKGKITHFISSMGTTGTIMGVGKFLKSKNPAIRIIGVQPQEGESIPGIRRWSKEFLPPIFDATYIDQTINVSKQEAIDTMKRMAKAEGIFAGMSSGGAMAAALKLSTSLEKAYMVTIACDRGDRYLSTGIFS